MTHVLSYNNKYNFGILDGKMCRFDHNVHLNDKVSMYKVLPIYGRDRL